MKFVKDGFLYKFVSHKNQFQICCKLYSYVAGNTRGNRNFPRTCVVVGGTKGEKRQEEAVTVWISKGGGGGKICAVVQELQQAGKKRNAAKEKKRGQSKEAGDRGKETQPTIQTWTLRDTADRYGNRGRLTVIITPRKYNMSSENPGTDDFSKEMSETTFCGSF